MHNTHVRIRNKNYNRLIKYQSMYRLKYHQGISMAEIINALIANKIPSINVKQSTLDKIQYRFNDKNYRQLSQNYFKFQKAIIIMNRKFSNGFNNINQLAKLGNGTDKFKFHSAIINDNTYGILGFLFKEIKEYKPIIKDIDKKGSSIWLNM